MKPGFGFGAGWEPLSPGFGPGEVSASKAKWPKSSVEGGWNERKNCSRIAQARWTSLTSPSFPENHQGFEVDREPLIAQIHQTFRMITADHVWAIARV